jgi:hypothetical protein
MLPTGVNQWALTPMLARALLALPPTAAHLRLGLCRRLVLLGPARELVLQLALLLPLYLERPRLHALVLRGC